MTTLDRIKIKLIDKINLTQNEQLLSTIDNIFDSNQSKQLFVLSDVHFIISYLL